MKKILCIFISVLMLIPAYTALAAINPEDDGHTIERFTDNFSGYTNPDNLESVVPANWKKSAKGVSLPFNMEDGVHDVVFGLHIPENTTGYAMWLDYETLAADDKNFSRVKIQMDFYTDRRVAFKVYDGAASKSYKILEVTSTGSLTIAGASSGSCGAGWHTGIFYFDCRSKVMTVYIDGVLKADAVSADLPSNIGSIRVETAQKATDSNQWVYIDNVSVHTAEPVNVTDISVSNNCEDFPKTDGNILFTFDRNLRNDENFVKVLAEDGTEFTGFETAVIGNQVSVHFTGVMDAGKKYTVNANGGSVNITTNKDKLIVKKPVLSFNENTVSAQCYVENGDEVPRDATLVVATYDADNKMVLPLETKTVTLGTEEDNKSETIMSDEVYCDESMEYRVFVIDNTDNLNLLRSDYIGGMELTYKGNGTINPSIERIYAENDKFHINANFDIEAERTLLVTAKDEEGNIQFISPVICDGVVEYSFAPSSEIKHTIYLTGRNMVSTEPTTLLFTSSARQADIIEEINGAANPDALGVSLNTYMEELDLYNELLEENGYYILFERLPVGISDIKPVLENAKSLLGAINEASWSSIREIILENSDILLYENSDFKYYKKLKEYNQNAINKNVVKSAPFDSIKDFRKVFEKAVKSAKSAAVSATVSGGTSSGDSSGGISGGTSGGSSVATPGGAATVSKPAPEPEVIPEPEEIPEEKGEIFSDISEAPWAEEGINYLSAKKIISGDGNGNFRPYDNIRREEFIKIVVEAFNIGDKSAGCTFSDAESDAWYTPYLAAAQSAGIIQGSGDNKFGVGVSITREDMAVILYRVLVKTGKMPVTEGVSEEFTDSEQISDYAKEAVMAFKKAGIFSGMPDGSFMPQENANRAQSCVTLYNILKGEVTK